jgi:hypothetical protein
MLGVHVLQARVAKPESLVEPILRGPSAAFVSVTFAAGVVQVGGSGSVAQGISRMAESGRPQRTLRRPKLVQCARSTHTRNESRASEKGDIPGGHGRRAAILV